MQNKETTLRVGFEDPSHPTSPLPPPTLSLTVSFSLTLSSLSMVPCLVASSTSINMTQQQQQPDLHIPLLGDELCYDVTQSAEDTAKKPVDKNNNDEQEDDLSKLVDNIYFAICMPLFLFIQFGFAFYTHQQDNETTTMTTSVSWSTVNWNICLFVVTVWLYRWACIHSSSTNSVLLFLPKIMTSIVLVILFFGHIEMAFDALLVGLLLMSLLFLAATIHCLICRCHPDDKINVEAEDGEEEEENDYCSLKKQVDIRLV